MYKVGIILLVVVVLLMCGCRQNETDKFCQVSLQIENAYNQKIYLETIPYDENPKIILDSHSIKERSEFVQFVINDTSENLYCIRSADNRLRVDFINEKPGIKIKADYFEPAEFSFEQGVLNNQLHIFLKESKKLTIDLRAKYGQRPPDSISIQHLQLLQNRYRSFTDSVQSPAAILYIYNGIDFGNDRAGLREYIDRLGKKFPNHTGIKKLVKETDQFLSIFEVELEPGTVAPDIAFEDVNGFAQTLSAYKGKFILLDFWAGWCGPCRDQSLYKREAWSKFKDKNFTIVSVSLDPDKDTWIQAMQQDGYTWPNFRDEKSWRGKSVNAYKFDSIPFNFLINPEGNIIAKALYGDSIQAKLNSLIR